MARFEAAFFAFLETAATQTEESLQLLFAELIEAGVDLSQMQTAVSLYGTLQDLHVAQFKIATTKVKCL